MVSRPRVGRLRKHSVLKSDWFSVILTCRKEQIIRMFIKEYRHGFRTLYFVTQVKDDKYFNALFRFDSLNRQMCAHVACPPFIPL